MTETKTGTITFSEIKTAAADFRNFCRGFTGVFFKSVKKYWYVFLVFFAAATAYTLYKHAGYQPYYEAKATFTFSDFTKKLYGDMAVKLRMLVHSGSYKAVAQKLQISESEAQNILDIKAFNLSGSPLEEDVNPGRDAFYVTIKTRNRPNGDSVTGIVKKYFNRNKQVEDFRNSYFQKMQMKHSYVTQQIVKIDSFQEAYRAFLLRQSKTSEQAAAPVNPVLIYRHEDSLLNVKSDLEAGMRNYEIVKELDPFLFTDTPVQYSLPSKLFYADLISLAAASFLSMLLFVFKN